MNKPNFGSADFWRQLAELIIAGLKLGGVLEKKAAPDKDDKKKKEKDEELY